MSDPQSRDKPAEPTPPDTSAPDAKATGAKPGPKPSSVVKPVRRPGVATVRRAPGETGTNLKAPGPPPPDKFKNMAFIACGVVLVAILGLGSYVVFHGKTVAPQRALIERLSPEGKELARKVDSATELYNDGKSKASGENLDDLRTAATKLGDAAKLFNEIADLSQTIDGYKEKIDFVVSRKETVYTKDLNPLREKITRLEAEERANKAKAAQASKPVAPNAPAAPAEVKDSIPPESEISDLNIRRVIKEDPDAADKLIKQRLAKDPTYKPPPPPDLSDENIKRLMNDDPSEGEKLVKLRQKKDPTYKAPN